MDKATRLILKVIGEQVGLTADQVKDEASLGTLGYRYEMCKGCRISDCSRCQIAFNKKAKITH